MAKLSADLQQQVDDGLITRKEAHRIAAGKNPNGTRKEASWPQFASAKPSRLREKDRGK